ncbi:hypothetical protein [Xanthomonas albilineans]|uniref:Uncharacterized protein n=1 Tax=Xanthomonas albilineans (strain GPE PC73 / CFBP 7063) TaxID=380358 RepID=D2UGX6_XANAP|nr:hypothetical protein [Xanthomonas albilineans]CBA17637.1 hypothetical protein XALC_3158 [Xanthomonas albilineans GPE PC73]
MFLFFFRRFRLQRRLQRALRAAVAMHRAEALRYLLAAHGARAFAKAVSAQSPRVLADALSLLPVDDRIRVRARLSHAAQRRLHAAGMPASTLNRSHAVLAWWLDASLLRRD